MTRIAATFAMLLLAANVHAAEPPHPGNEKPIYKIDSVIATRHGNRLAVHVTGAVKGGGWKTPRLRQAKSDPHSIVLDFVATPPPPDSAVFPGVLPVSANIVVRLPRTAVTVRAVSDANEMTTQILR